MLFVACESKTKKENRALREKVTALQQENEAYKNKQVKMNASIEDYKKFLKEINSNLKEIDLSSSIIGQLNKEVKKDAELKEAIRTRVKNVSELIRNSRLKIIALDGSLNELRKTSSAQGEEILNLDNQLKQATRELMSKEEAFIELSATQEELEELYNEQMKITNDLKSLLNRAYYFVGTSKELKEKGVIEKEGGFIGIGRVKIVNASAPEAIFMKDAKDEMDSLVVTAKKISLVTNHPEHSYTIKEGDEKQTIYITDKKAFWNQGNYLIVEKK